MASSSLYPQLSRWPFRRGTVSIAAGIVLLGAVIFKLWPAIASNITNQRFLPHSFCYLQKPGLIRLHLTSDLAIGISYVVISLTLAYLVYRARKEIPFSWMLLVFGTFIVACGLTHFMEVVTLWKPLYWLAGDIKAVTAMASVVAAVLLPPLIPKTLRLISSARVSEERGRQLELAHERLRELDELKTRFFANVSHELRTPLTLVLGPARKLLRDTAPTPEQSRQLQIIESNAQLVLKRVNDLLEISKLQAGKSTLHCSIIDFTKMVQLTAANFNTLASDRGIRYQVLACEPLPVEADPDKIERILINLVSNAFKFTPDGGCVRIELSQRETKVYFTISDSGIGVRPEHRKLIFEPFRQSDAGISRRFGGTGLGLAIVKDLVELHGGHVTVEDAPEGGALFKVDLPLATALPDAPIAPEANAESNSQIDAALLELAAHKASTEGIPIRPAAQVMEAQGNESNAPLVLVVEDNRELNTFIRDALSGQYRVLSAHNGREGLNQAIAHRPDLVVTDIMMPELSGDQLIHELRSRPGLDDVPVLVLSARADDDLRFELLRSGAQDYVTKPFLAEELTARIHNLVTISCARHLLQEELITKNRDIAAMTTELLARNRVIREREARLQSLAETLPQLVWIARPNGETEYANRRWREYSGDQVELPHPAWEKLVHPDDKERVLKSWRESLASGQPFDLEYRLRRQDGAYCYHIVRALPLRGEDGAIQLWIGSSTEIQAQKEAEELLHNQAARLVTAVAEKTAELHDTISQLESFCYTVSHDLRAPLRSIHGFASLIVEDHWGTLDEPGKQKLGRIIAAAKRMDALITDLLAYSRLGRTKIPRVPVDLQSIVSTVISELPEPDRAVVQVNIHPDARVLGEQQLLLQVIANLISNALKFHAKGTQRQVEIYTETRPDGWRLSVRDNGIGIDPAYQEKIFGVFERLHASDEFPGTGIGLAIVKRSVERLSGQLGLESDNQRGSTFWFELPGVDSALAA